MLIITLCVCVCQPWLVHGFFVHQQLSIPHLQNKGLQFDNREQSMREIDTINLQQLQVHYFMVNCRCPFFPPLKTKGTDSKKGKRRLKSLPHWKRKPSEPNPSFGFQHVFNHMFGGEFHGNPVIFRAKRSAQGFACCFLLGRCPRKRIADINRIP